MIRILFVCWGNICRSPMAEFVMKDLVQKAGLADRFQIASAATSDEEVWRGYGSPVYPPARKELERHGLSCEGKRARQMTRADYDAYDLLIGMEGINLRYMKQICGGDPQGKMSLLLDHTGHPGDIDDPWYTRDFAGVYRQISEGCRALLEECRKEAEKGRSV